MRYWKPRKIAGTPKVGIAVAAYLNEGPMVRQKHNAYMALCGSLLAQTYPHHVIHTWHDGPYETSQPPSYSGVHFRQTEERKQKFGHPHRQAAVAELLAGGCDWILLTNQDNYYAPVFLEWLVSEGQRLKVPFVYCDFVRSHLQWAPFTTRAKKGHLDLGGFIAHRSIVEKVKFDKTTFNGDGDYIERLVQAARARTAKVPAALFVHN